MKESGGLQKVGHPSHRLSPVLSVSINEVNVETGSASLGRILQERTGTALFSDRTGVL